jgi:hypothetical protein
MTSGNCVLARDRRLRPQRALATPRELQAHDTGPALWRRRLAVGMVPLHAVQPRHPFRNKSTDLSAHTSSSAAVIGMP